VFSIRTIIAFTIVIIFISNKVIVAQQNSTLDSLTHFFLAAHNISIDENTYVPSTSDTVVHKCGFGAATALHLNFNNLSEANQRLLKPVLSRPSLDTSIVSPENLFRIHFRKSGSLVPRYDVHEFAKACDSSYNFEVNYLGYPPPPFDNGAGGDDKYDIYILDLSGLYGYTQPETEVSPGSKTFTSYIVVDNDFLGYYTTGINAARVTIAHEFHHAIQMGNYIVREENSEIVDGFFYELTSTAMEEFVYDSINDYYAYMSDNTEKYFNYTDKAFGKNNGYNLAIWNIFLEKTFGHAILMRQWELLRDNRALKAIHLSLVEANSNYGFAEALNTFNVWTFFSGHRAIQGKYFEEASFYPQIKIGMSTLLTGSEKSIQSNVNPTGSSFINFVNSSTLDSIVIAITNSDLVAGIDASTSSANIKYTLCKYQADGTFRLTDNYFAKFEAMQPSFWNTAEFINNELAKEGNFTSLDIDTPYPSPFLYTKSAHINFPLKEINTNVSELYVYSTAMNLVYTSVFDVDKAKKRIRWDGKDRNGNKLSSGVYIYVINQNNTIHKGKLVIINE
jgi:hypothetical protein